MELKNKIKEAADFIQTEYIHSCPKTAVVSGSGLGVLGDELNNKVVLDVDKIPYWPVPTVEGHTGKVIFGKIANSSVLLLQGRVHLYEGYSLQDVTFPIRVLGELGVKNLVLTNAAGGINPEFVPGDLMLITDHINFMFTNPLIGNYDSSLGTRFPDMSHPYDLAYIDLAEEIGKDRDILLRKGVLIAVTGPSYETTAEIKMFRYLGADAVCMSTVPEVIVGVQMGFRILGISCITNMGTGVASEILTHEEVTKTAQKVKKKFVSLLREIIVRISEG